MVKSNNKLKAHNIKLSKYKSNWIDIESYVDAALYYYYILKSRRELRGTEVWVYVNACCNLSVYELCLYKNSQVASNHDK